MTRCDFAGMQGSIRRRWRTTADRAAEAADQGRNAPHARRRRADRSDRPRRVPAAQRRGGGVGDLGALAGQTVGPGTASTDLQTECRTGADANDRDDCRIVAVVNSVQAYWDKTVRNYEPARTRFFTDSIQTGCGQATSAVGPFYCPQRPVRLHRPRVLRGSPVGARRTRRPSRRGVRPRARVRPSRPEPDRRPPRREPRHRPAGWAGTARAPGRLLRRALGRPRPGNRVRGGHHAPGCCRRARRCGSGGRRPDPGESAEGQVRPESWTHGSSEQRKTLVHPGDRGIRPPEL